MNQSVEMLLKKMGEDNAFAEKILTQTEKEKVIEIAKEEGIDLTMEDIDEANQVIVKSLQLSNEGELSEEDLETVAGGTIMTSLEITASVTAISLTAIGSATTVPVLITTATMVSSAVTFVSAVSLGSAAVVTTPVITPQINK